MENEYPEENTPRTPVSPVEGTRGLNDKPNLGLLSGRKFAVSRAQ